jgi:class 3 adenylate cyclase
MLNHKDIFIDLNTLIEREAELPEIKEELWKKYGTKSTMLILDSSGFTRVSKSHTIYHFLICLVKMRNIVHSVFQKYHCRNFYSISDNIYAEFDTPDVAFEASRDANRAIVEAELMLTEDEPFSICVGIGYGDVLRSKSEGLFGDEMNLASKLGEDIANAGEILMTESAYGQLSEEYQTKFQKYQRTVAGVDIQYYLRSTPFA